MNYSLREQARKLFSIALGLSLLSLITATAFARDKMKVDAPAGMKLVWSDEFDKKGRPDPRKWDYERGFVRNEEAQFYQSENAFVKGGKLIIEARRERKPNPNYKAGSDNWRTNREFVEYTSSSLITQGKASWLYGRFEIRARIDTRAGLWPAFWTLGETGEWPSGGEIDIMEYYRGKLMANVAWGTNKRWNAKWNSIATPITEFNDPNWADKFHVWSLDWDENQIVISVDDKVLNKQDVNQTINGDAEHKNPFRAPQTILLNLAVGGQSGGDPTPTDFPARFEVDYVRVYQKK